jgi:transcriptional regulator
VYVPHHFKPRDPKCVWEVISEHGFGTLVSMTDTGPLASPLPFLVRPDEHMLVGRVARANPQFERLRQCEAPVLVLFHGPSAFVSGAYYRDPAAIPTWNHVTVHVTGTPMLIHGMAATLRVLEDAVAHFESRAGSDWRLDLTRPDLPGFVGQIAAFTIAISHIEASFKLSQNVSVDERTRVVTGLRADGRHDVARAIEAENCGSKG